MFRFSRFVFAFICALLFVLSTGTKKVEAGGFGFFRAPIVVQRQAFVVQRQPVIVQRQQFFAPQRVIVAPQRFVQPFGFQQFGVQSFGVQSFGVQSLNSGCGAFLVQ